MFLKKIIHPFLIAVFIFTGSYSNAQENSIHHPIIDSAITLEEALKGLSKRCPENIKNNQTLVDVLYYSTDELVHKGQVVVDQRLADDIKEIFEIALKEKFPFEKVIPINQFNWNDDRSMAKNNTSSFNYRKATGRRKLSNHAYGYAIDVNPFFNPYIKGEKTLPPRAVYNPSESGTLTADHIIVKTFLMLGWEWGGNWQSLKDYQHFEKPFLYSKADLEKIYNDLVEKSFADIPPKSKLVFKNMKIFGMATPITLKVFINFNKINKYQWPKEAVIGLMAHELAHMVSYERRTIVGRMGYTWNYPLSMARKKKVEREADQIAIERGYGKELVQERIYQFRDEKKKNAKKQYKIYYSPEGLERLMNDYHDAGN